MSKQNISEIEKLVERKYQKRDKKKKKIMKVSGSQVKNLQRIISEKL